MLTGRSFMIAAAGFVTVASCTVNEAQDQPAADTVGSSQTLPLVTADESLQSSETTSSPTTPTDPLEALVLRCLEGDFVACDDLALSPDATPTQREVGATCGRTLDEPSGSCADQSTQAFSTNTDPRGAPAVGTPSGVLVDSRSGRHDGEGFDRFVLEFEDGGIPAYSIGYRGEGELLLIVEAAYATDGSDQVDNNSRFINAAMLDVGSETMDWLLDVDTTRGFEVFTLESPPRIAVDVSAD